jgi:hypothetical protein
MTTPKSKLLGYIINANVFFDNVFCMIPSIKIKKDLGGVIPFDGNRILYGFL